MANFNGTYVSTTTLGTLADGRIVELGHYKDNASGKEYADKVYLTGTYQTKKGEEKSFVNSTGLTLKDLAEIQKIDLSSFDTETEVTFD